MKHFSLYGRRALVTGGSVSIGKGIALALAEAGADVAIQYFAEADRDFGLPDAAQKTCAEIAALGRKGFAIQSNFEVAGSGISTVAEACRLLGSIDILVVAASVQKRQSFSDISSDELKRQSQINFFSTIELLQAAIPSMASRGWGRILSIGSVNEDKPEAELAVYAALKAAQSNLILNLAKQYANTGVTLNTLSPGLVATERNRWRRQDACEWKAIQQKANPMERAGTVEDIVGSALLLCSPASAFITGANLQATGGAHL